MVPSWAVHVMQGHLRMGKHGLGISGREKVARWKEDKSGPMASKKLTEDKDSCRGKPDADFRRVGSETKAGLSASNRNKSETASDEHWMRSSGRAPSSSS